MSKVKEAYKEIEDVIGSDFVTDKDFMKAAYYYWLGESISQSVVEAGAYTPEFSQFFKDMKKTVDPDFLLSPNKFHLHSYEDDISKYIVKDEE